MFGSRIQPPEFSLRPQCLGPFLGFRSLYLEFLFRVSLVESRCVEIYYFTAFARKTTRTGGAILSLAWVRDVCAAARG